MDSASDAVVATLAAHDVEHVFGVVGDTSISLYESFATNDHGIDHVLAHDERHAAYMADCYARLGEKPGVVEGPSGGGVTYLTPGLAEANDSAVPVVSMNTDIPVRLRGRGVLTELDQEDVFEPVTKWQAAVEHPEQVPRMIRQAFRRATTGRPGATHLSFPMDVLAADPEGEVYPAEAATTYPAYRPTPDAERLDRAAELLTGADSPVVVAGGGVHASQAWTELRTFAERLGVPVAESLTAAGAIGDSPYEIGVVGENGFRAYADEIVQAADALFLAGTAAESVWTDKWSQPTDRSVPIVRADIDAGAIGLNYETAVALPGDLRATLTALLERVHPAQKWDADDLRERHEDWHADYAEAFDSDEYPLRPERLVGGAADVLDDDAVIVSDAGTGTPYFASLYPFTEPGRHWVTPRAHGALGYALPAAVGAAKARPDGQVLAVCGDGSFGMAVGELETYARLGLDVTCIVVNNDSFSWIKAGQENYADFSFGVGFSEGMDYAAVADRFGVPGYRVDSADEYETSLAAAMDHDGPAVVDIPTRPLETIDDVPVDWLEPGEGDDR